MGDPDFDFDLADRSSRAVEALSSKSEIENRQSGIDQSLLTSAATTSLSRSFRSLNFKRLQGSADEARTSARLLGDERALRLGAQARERELKAVRSPRVLHLATHGFFLSDQEFKNTNSVQELSLADTRSGRRSFVPPGNRWENPMVRCGIALAGANHAQQITNAVAEDGLLTGLEASLLNPQGTALVILSACDTGSGEIKIGEGLMSLRRAFRIAGAESVLASHWKVSDKATSRLMTEFMRRWRAGEPRA
jgi:CHAT domain-containing protein